MEDCRTDQSFSCPNTMIVRTFVHEASVVSTVRIPAESPSCSGVLYKLPSSKSCQLRGTPLSQFHHRQVIRARVAYARLVLLVIPPRPVEQFEGAESEGNRRLRTRGSICVIMPRSRTQTTKHWSRGDERMTMMSHTRPRATNALVRSSS